MLLFPRLESIESQDALMDVLTKSVAGVAGARKELHALGGNPARAQVEDILRRASSLPLSTFLFSHHKTAEPLNS
jgi:hypothetical protein